LGVSCAVRILCGFIIYEYEGFQVAAALTAYRKISPDLAAHTQHNIRSIQKQGALESIFGGRQLILVSTVLLPTVVEAAFYPLLPCFQVFDPPYWSALAKITVKTFSFAVLICIAAQVSSQIKAIGGPVAWMRRKTTKYVIKSVSFAESMGLISPAQFLADKLAEHHDLDGQSATLHEWSSWWSEKIAAGRDTGKSPPPFLLPPDHDAHIMPHRVLCFLLSHRDDVLFHEKIIPVFIYASFHGLDEESTRKFWTWVRRNAPDKLAGNPQFIWRTSADTLGHVSPHHMLMVLFSSSLLIMKSGASPDIEIGNLFGQFAQASFDKTDEFKNYWSRVRKFKIGNRTPLSVSRISKRARSSAGHHS
jgi:hypothetical protein